MPRASGRANLLTVDDGVLAAAHDIDDGAAAKVPMSSRTDLPIQPPDHLQQHRCAKPPLVKEASSTHRSHELSQLISDEPAEVPLLVTVTVDEDLAIFGNM